MPLEKWLIKVKNSITQSFDSVLIISSTPPNRKGSHQIKKSQVGVLAFEISSLMSKVLNLWQSLSDKNIARLRNESIRLEGVRKIVSNDDTFLLGLACAELVESLRLIAKSISRISKKCENSTLRSFDRFFDEFVNTGRDPNNLLITGSKDVESKIKKLDHFVAMTTTLHKEIDELVILENTLKKSLQISSSSSSCNNKDTREDVLTQDQKIIDLQQKILWQRQEIKYLKEKSLWCRSFDTVTLLLARCAFTVLSRIKLVFGLNHSFPPSSLPRSLSSSSALVYPSENHNNYNNISCTFVSGPLTKNPPNDLHHHNNNEGFFESNSKILNPPTSTLGSAALSLHYANLIIVMEKMIRSPQLVGLDARDDLYSMLPNSVRSALRARLKGIGFSASDPILLGEWRDALHKILGWLSPLAHNMIKWQSERSFEQHNNNNNTVPKSNVLLFQTLYYANQEKAEAAIAELLVGLNYIWRFEREMNAKVMFQCTNLLRSKGSAG